MAHRNSSGGKGKGLDGVIRVDEAEVKAGASQPFSGEADDLNLERLFHFAQGMLLLEDAGLGPVCRHGCRSDLGRETLPQKFLLRSSSRPMRQSAWRARPVARSRAQ